MSGACRMNRASRINAKSPVISETNKTLFSAAETVSGAALNNNNNFHLNMAPQSYN